MSSPRQGAVRVKTPKTRELETQAKIKRIRVRLEEIAEYKRVLAVDGIQPDGDDKRLESELIVRLLYLEKELKNMAPEALAMKAREREEEEARNATVATASLKRGQSSPRRAFDAKPARPAPTDAPKKPFVPRTEPWRSPYAASDAPTPRQDTRKSTTRPGAKPAAARSHKRPDAKSASDRSPDSRGDKRPYAKQSDSRGDKRSPYAKPAGDSRDKRSPYAKPVADRSSDSRGEKRSPYAKPAADRSSDSRGDKRSPYAKPASDRSSDSRDKRSPYAKPAAAGEKRPSPYAKSAEGRSTGGRGDRRPSPYAKQADGRSGKGPTPHAKQSDGRGDKRPSPYTKKPAEKRYAKPKANPDARDESSTLTSAGEKKGYWSRDDRRVRSGKRPAAKR